MSTPPRSPSKEIEAGYFRHIPAEALTQSLTKPFSASNRASLLIEIGAVISLLPEPPARLVDLGCGTGWTSAFLARCGYDVVGTDLAPEAVTAAQATFGDLPDLAVTYRAHDFDQPLPEELGRFDAAVFFDCLHHSEDEARPIKTAYLALKPGGVCVVCEPGRGHADSETSRTAHETFGVRERDMPPTSVVAAGRAAGFARSEVYPHPQELARHVYFERDTSTWRGRLLASRTGEVARLLRAVTVQRKQWGLVRLSKA